MLFILGSVVFARDQSDLSVFGAVLRFCVDLFVIPSISVAPASRGRSSHDVVTVRNVSLTQRFYVFLSEFLFQFCIVIFVWL